MNINIADQRVERVSIDFAVALLVASGGEIRIGTKFSVTLPDGETTTLEPERITGTFAWLNAILHATVTSASVAEDTGDLVVDFANGTHVRVNADQSYEAWTYAGSDGSKIVALPGGGIAVWRPTRD